MQDMQRAFVLHTRPYRETSLIVDLFCEDIGRLSVVVKGGRGRKGSAALFQPFQEIWVAYGGHSELKTLLQVEPGELKVSLSGLALYSGFYLNELVLKLLPVQGGVSGLFSHYISSLSTLASGQQIEPSLREFELALLDELGLGIDFGFESTSGSPVVSHGTYRVGLNSGVQRVDSIEDTGVDGATMLAIAQRAWQDSNVLQAAKKICRNLINELLDGRVLQSRKVMQQFIEVQRQSK
ncbi:DNA repair protein RecO [Hahella sp. CCB-MM4]|uniref:DNA repair protein RecO n=1 Tax=Hahella sp. (strain CCB-MM4) TaxID=1926491 RepID=UPI000B9C4207|nr:DNA repair protein RecO [Hahella sp. CCB-MM4]OZG70616.1 DNA repair protein RecO [Hahella sp. CCB-MM4]